MQILVVLPFSLILLAMLSYCAPVLKPHPAKGVISWFSDTGPFPFLLSDLSLICVL